MENKWNLKNFAVGSLPTTFYIPDFITETEEHQLFTHIYQAPKSKWKSLKNRRLQNWGGIVHEKGLLLQDRICAVPPWLTDITERIYKESDLFPSALNHVLINEYLPDQGIMPHQDGPAYFPVVAILSLGSPVVMDFSPHSRLRQSTNTAETESSVDEGNSTRWLDDHRPFSILLMPRSLLIFKDEAYSDYLHGIKDTKVQQCDGVVNIGEALKSDQLDHPPSDLVGALSARAIEDVKTITRAATRISLTCRLVPKVHKNLFRF
ncbi:Alpha-ketoglutarate-dependent dioxygenase AlkB-like [Dillenia turbinata]|uniref:Alpha-ketoglutarate-dependent dioxygenase AlkB-like n=1 Tax=Dillenia turbinata TaxID=194707 RepID=A0AAN8W3B4_9MAGN